MNLTITLFVEPSAFVEVVKVLQILEGLPLENNYVFNPKELIFKEEMIPSWIWLNVPIRDYLKLKYSMNVLSNN